ncbi:MAG TPA: hypothetical protein VKU61_11360 [Candidatus Binatia bacterium]|nr:hypothetical protein [Candidatus Binatia bacterium]
MAPRDPVRVESPSGLRAEINANGSIRRFFCGDVVLNAYVGNEMEGGPANLYLRRRTDAIAWTPLLGPQGPGTVHVDAGGLVVRGEWNALRFTVTFRLAATAPAWFWHVALENVGATPVDVDLIHAQDIALADYGMVRLNEYYASQYVDHTPLTHPDHGSVVAVRQNLSMGGRHPWALLGSLARGVAYATDALQLHGLATRAGEPPAALGAPALPGRRLQHEHAMVAIQDAAVALAPGARAERGFFGWFEADHPAASSAADVAVVERVLALAEASPRAVPVVGTPVAATFFSSRPMLRTLDLPDAELTGLFGGERRLVEDQDGSLLSFFTGTDAHVVLRAKELRVLRPHGHIMRTGGALVPEEASLTSTAWMAGVFHSLVTQGNVGLNRIFSTTRSYLGLARAGGVRIFVELVDGFHLLGVPSAWETTPDGCRWIYRHAGGTIAVRSRAVVDRHELELAIDVLGGAPARFLVSHHVALDNDDGATRGPVDYTRDAGGVTLRPAPESDLARRHPGASFRIEAPAGTLERVGGDELLFADGQSRGEPFLVLVTAPVSSVRFRITGTIGGVAAPGVRRRVRSVTFHPPSDAPDVLRLQEILPWFAHDALVHYLAPRGLEQFSGGAWGTRDVCQGPVEMLLARGDVEPVRDILVRVFGNQNPDGDWPQWFMFFDAERTIRAGDSHGDVVFWPLLALARYLLAAEDATILDEAVPFFGAETATITRHVERALGVIDRRVIRSTALAAYGHGDWNDSLQPVDPAMSEQLCSSWTVTLHHQTLTTLAEALARIGRQEQADALVARAVRVRDDFRRLLLPDATLAGFAHFRDDGSVEYLLHPRDGTTGIRYSLLPMIHALIAGLLTPDEARAHIGLIRAHLVAPDGARLFDRPPVYHGGLQRIFQRAESSSYFGREIGLMYVHAHLRWAESMARWGDADAFFLALRQANPIAIDATVASAARRQANCYYSSSDAAFADRYEATARYEEVMQGRVAVEGGWRVYSSGAGIAVRLVHECLLGLRRGRSRLVIDPVVPRALDGLRADVELAGRPVSVVYRVSGAGHGPTALTLNGAPLAFEREANPYRTGAAVIAMAALSALRPDGNELVVELGGAGEST